MKTHRFIFLVILSLSLWITPHGRAQAGACCAKSKETAAATCAEKCGCCCTPVKQEPDPAKSCCAGKQVAEKSPTPSCDGGGCQGCTCMAQAPHGPAPLIPVVPPPARTLAPELTLPRHTVNAFLASLTPPRAFHQHEIICWTGPPVYLLNDVFRI